MASDIPDAWESPHAMAKSLATYIDCPHEIVRRVKSHYYTSPCVSRVRELQKIHRNPLNDIQVWHGDVYRQGEDARKLDRVNATFLWLLDQERLAMQRRTEQ